MKSGMYENSLTVLLQSSPLYDFVVVASRKLPTTIEHMAGLTMVKHMVGYQQWSNTRLDKKWSSTWLDQQWSSTWLDQQWAICNGCDVIVEVLDGLFVVHLDGLGVPLGLEPQVGDGGVLGGEPVVVQGGEGQAVLRVAQQER